MSSYEGLIVDLDGVVTRTATLHFRAWKATFEEFLEGTPDSSGDNTFSHQDDYIPYVDGRPRYQGVKRFLESRDVVLPFGTPDDDPGHDTVCALGNKKHRRFREILKQEGAEVFGPAVELIKREKSQGRKTAIVSSSEDCALVLRQAGIEELFDTRVDGRVSAELRLEGKPAPDIFLVAADNIGVAPARAVVVEDAEAGVAAGCRGNFGLVVGVDRHGNRESLRSHGADLVVSDLSELTEEFLEHWFEEGRREESWTLGYHGYEPQEERLREALTTVGNGYLGTRGALPWEDIADDVHYPGTYFMGLFNKVPTEVHGRTIYNNDFVNCPNWSSIKLSVDDGPYFAIGEVEVLEYEHSIDLKHGLCRHSIRFRDDAGRITRYSDARLVSMERMHLAAVECTVVPENYAGRLTILSAIDGRVINYGVERYRDLTSKHLEPVSEEEREDGAALVVKTTESDIQIVMEARTRVLQFANGGEGRGTEEVPGLQRGFVSEQKYVAERFTFEAEEGREYRLEKAVGIATSRDMDNDDHLATARETLETAGSFEEVLGAHKRAWEGLWNRSDIVIEGDRFSQQTIRLHIHHLLTTASPHNTRIDAGMTARGLHGEAYRGHFFWDELFTLPFYNLHFPQVTRSFLMYRYQRLDAAREYARQEGYRGAMFPWQSADTGEEESQIIHYNPRSGEWDPDLSRNQRHISLAVAYNIWTYFYATNDLDFLHHYGIEMLLEISRFWVSLAHFEEENGRYHISGVMGPNEFHEKYPGAEEGGFRDNAYTNIVTAWLLHKTMETYEHLPEGVKEEMGRRIAFDEEELRHWGEVKKGLAVVIQEDGVISQFDGWMSLRELDWDRYREKYDSINRLDRILKAENDSPDRYKISKQADMLMTFYLMAPGQVKHTLEMMGYEVGDETELIRKNYEYYVRRTSHGSTLSYVVHSSIARYIPGYRRRAWKWFTEAMKSDRYDTQGGTTPEGIHCGVMAGTIGIILENFAGINLFADHFNMAPELPKEWSYVAFKLEQRGRLFDIKITKDQVTIDRVWSQAPEEPPLSVVINGEEHTLGDETLKIRY